MVFRLIDQKIRKAFSDAAIQYDVLSSLQSEIGRELTKKVTSLENVSQILDVGMGPGKLTRRMSFYFPEAKVTGIDFADGMIQLAKQKREGIAIVQADARRLPFKEENFDLVVSNLTYQWVDDLAAAFAQAFVSLKKEGKLVVTMFGHRTFQELFEALLATKEEKNNNVLGNRLVTQEQIKQAVMSAGFSTSDVDYELIEVHFPDMMTLLRWIKDIGANCLNPDIFIGRDHLQRANEYYDAHYREKLGIKSTFEVVWINAQK